MIDFDILSKAATMGIPINSNGDSRTAEDDSLEQDMQHLMVSRPNLNEPALFLEATEGQQRVSYPRIANQPGHYPAPSMHHSNSNLSMMSEKATRGVAVEKFDSVKKWSIDTYKCTKQMFSKHFGRDTKTMELEAQIDVLRETKMKYEHILRLACELTNHFYNMIYNVETQRLLCKNGEILLGAINFFVSSINRLFNKTMEDTLMTLRMYENARLEFAAYITDLEDLSVGLRGAEALVRIEIAQQQYQIHEDKYERLHSDVSIKLKFLEENKVKVMHKQLLLFYNAVAAYFTGNQFLTQTTQGHQYNMKLTGAEFIRIQNKTK
uniref:AH domain-containing protein n=1 Tax=Cyprinus carpio carpio TaxID=630221 RepID=A0A8C1I1I5_CYPCA